LSPAESSHVMPLRAVVCRLVLPLCFVASSSVPPCSVWSRFAAQSRYVAFCRFVASRGVLPLSWVVCRCVLPLGCVSSCRAAVSCRVQFRPAGPCPRSPALPGPLTLLTLPEPPQACQAVRFKPFDGRSKPKHPTVAKPGRSVGTACLARHVIWEKIPQPSCQLQCAFLVHINHFTYKYLFDQEL